SSSPYPPRAPPPPTPVPYTPLFRSLARLQLRRHPRLGDRLIKERLAVDPQLAVVHIILARRVRLDQLVPFTPLERPQTDGNLFSLHLLGDIFHPLDDLHALCLARDRQRGRLLGDRPQLLLERLKLGLQVAPQAE